MPVWAPWPAVTHSLNVPMNQYSGRGSWVLFPRKDNTVKSEVFARVYFRAKLRSFATIKPSQNDGITEPFTDVGKSCSTGNF